MTSGSERPPASTNLPFTSLPRAKRRALIEAAKAADNLVADLIKETDMVSIKLLLNRQRRLRSLEHKINKRIKGLEQKRSRVRADLREVSSLLNKSEHNNIARLKAEADALWNGLPKKYREVSKP